MLELHLNPSLCASRLISDCSSTSQLSTKTELSTLWSSKVPMYMIDATWKLNQWEEMDKISSAFHTFVGLPNSEFSKQEQNHSLPSQPKKKSCGSFGPETGVFVPNIGPVLLSLKNKEALFVFQSKLNDIRSSVLGHLKAAMLSNQQSAYQRAYSSSIVPLHLIHDVYQFSQTIYEKLIQNNATQDEDVFQCFENLKSGWEARNRFIPLVASGHSSNVIQIIDVQRALVKILQQHSMQISPSNSDLYAVELFRYWAKGLATEIKCGHLDRAYANMLEATQLMIQQLPNAKPVLESLDLEERANFVLDTAKVHWCRRNDRGKSLIYNKYFKRFNYVLFIFFSCFKSDKK